MSSELLLVVCAANICRSPLAELLLRRGLARLPDVWVASAGTLAQSDREICFQVATWRDDESWMAEASAHRSRRIDPDLLEAAALILVSSRDVRADVVLAAPEVRGRTYTLREAAHLGDGFDAAVQTGHLGEVARYATHLDRARVVRGTIQGRRPRWGLTRRADGPDIVDGHGRNRWVHRAALEEVSEATAAVVRQLGGRRA
ncbi:arsenate reductase/protein-tyrosine-phosphatase family protein [Brachybacterium sp.]|uniref:arsenate reductase/protein-tyrosine-phosphatase family protein n=1 Tax=Brachybacterium sp. TaxID=1891286 RepID=UPI003F909293